MSTEELPEHVQAELLSSVEARATRAAEKLAALQLNFNGKPRGQRPPEVDPEILSSMAEAPLSHEAMFNLSQRLTVRRPLFSRFTSHNRFVPAPRSLGVYLEAERHKSKLAPTDPNERIGWEQAKERRPLRVKDNIQQSLFIDWNIARLRGAAVHTLRYLLWNELPLDPETVVFASDAVREYGYSLYDNPEILDDIGGKEFALHIAAIGEESAKNPKLLDDNQELLAIVEREQEKRQKFWGVRFRLTQAEYGDHLAQQHKDDGRWTDDEVARMQALCQA